MAQFLSPGQVIEDPAPISQAEQAWRENLNIRLICPDCREDPPNLTEEMSQGDTVCLSCGLVVGDRLVDSRSEWRTFANDESGGDDPSRVGKAVNPLDSGHELETSISFGDGNNRSRELNRAHAKMNQDKGRKALTEAFQRITQISNNLAVPEKTIEYAKHCYKLTYGEKIFKGKNPEAMFAGCVFIACRQCDMPRSFRDINIVTRVSKKDIGRTFKLLQSFLNNHKLSSIGKSVGKAGSNAPNGNGAGASALSINSISPDSFKDTQATSAEELCLRYGSLLVLTSTTINCSKSIATNLTKVGSLAGRSPLSAAAASIYMASHIMGEPKMPKEIARVAGVSDGTIRTAYKMLAADRDKIVEGKWLGEGRGSLERLPPV